MKSNLKMKFEMMKYAQFLSSKWKTNINNSNNNKNEVK